MNVIQESYSFGKFEKSLDATFITRIPKRARTSYVKDFRPISLVNGVYKFNPKVLANHLSIVVEMIVLKSQNVLIKRETNFGFHFNSK